MANKITQQTLTKFFNDISASNSEALAEEVINDYSHHQQQEALKRLETKAIKDAEKKLLAAKAILAKACTPQGKHLQLGLDKLLSEICYPVLKGETTGHRYFDFVDTETVIYSAEITRKKDIDTCKALWVLQQFWQKQFKEMPSGNADHKFYEMAEIILKNKAGNLARTWCNNTKSREVKKLD